MRIIPVLLILGLLPVSWAIAQTKTSKPGAKSAFDPATLEAYLRRVQIFRSPVTYKIDAPKPSQRLAGFSEVMVHLVSSSGSKDELYYISADGLTIVEGDVYNINKSPFQGNLDQLTAADQPSFGPANAPVTIFEFGDLQCPDCKMESPVLRRNIPQTFPDKVRVVFKDFPLESIHPWAREAAIAGRCVYHQNQEAFWKFYDWMYDTQDEITPENLHSKFLMWAGENALDAIQLGRCTDTKATEAEVNRSIAEARALGARGTPTLFINGRKMGGLQWPDLELIINHELQSLGLK